MMLECNLKVFSQAVLLAKAHKCTYTSTHDTRVCIEVQGLQVYPSSAIYHLRYLWAGGNQRICTSCHMTYGAIFSPFI